MFWNRPSICIVTPSLNQDEYIDSCIRSVLDTEYPRLDYVIMDGGSTDSSVEIIKHYASQLKYWCSTSDDGPYAAIVDGFEKSDADILGWINSDDMLTPWALPVIGQLFADCPEVEWVTSEIQLGIDTRGIPVTSKLLPGVSASGFYNAENLPGLLAGTATGFIQQESTFWRRSLWEKTECSKRPLASLAGDFDLWARFYEHAHLYTINIPLGLFRFHDNQRSVALRSEYLEQAKSVLKRYGNPLARKSETLLARYIQWCNIDVVQLRPFYEPRHIVRFDLVKGRYLAQEILPQK